MSYPFREETKTTDLRWYINSRDKPYLQQKVVIREGFGKEAKLREVWRPLETVVEGDLSNLQ